MSKIEYENIAAFHPGYYIRELIRELEITQEEFALRLSMTPKNLSDLIHGKASITRKVALHLSLMLGTSTSLWLDLQKTYDQKVIEINTLKKQIEEEKNLALIDYAFFEKLGVVPSTKNKRERMTALFQFFSISSFDVFKRPDFLVQFRQTGKIDEKLMLNANAWVQTVINLGKTIDTKPYSKRKLVQCLPQIREMTLQEPYAFMPVLKERLADCGIALVFIPSLKSSGVYGATKWINKSKVVVGITDRGKSADKFWFSLFHELGHVLQKKVKKMLVDFENQDLAEDIEKDADRFAKDLLIPATQYDSFVAQANFNESTLRHFAESVGIHPGIVVGRLQKEGLLSYKRLNHVKQKPLL